MLALMTLGDVLAGPLPRWSTELLPGHAPVS
jgi:hypothetical protein